MRMTVLQLVITDMVMDRQKVLLTSHDDETEDQQYLEYREVEFPLTIDACT
jgi:hypothetical protein